MGNVCRKFFGEVWTCGFFEMCKRINRHTDTLITIFRTPHGSEVITTVKSTEHLNCNKPVANFSLQTTCALDYKKN